jgi:hypothetical protein
MPGVHFVGNVEFPKSKTRFSFLEIHSRATELLLKFLEIFLSMKKIQKSSTFDGIFCTLLYYNREKFI